MVRYLCRRIVSAAVIILLVTIILYSLLALMRDNALNASNEPIWLRYFFWLRDAVQGRLGVSVRYGVPVNTILAQRLGPSALLAGTGLALAVLLGVPIGVMAASRPDSIWDRLSSLCALTGITLPSFLICITSIYIFSFRLRLLPAIGMRTAGSSSLGDLLLHLILPAVILAFSVIGHIIRQTRSACLDAFRQDWVKAARARGLPEHSVIIRHGLRTVLVPLLTQVFLVIPDMVAALAVTEKVFAWPGIGVLLIDAVRNRDAPLALGVTLAMAAVVLTANILLDIACVLLDPRTADQYNL